MPSQPSLFDAPIAGSFNFDAELRGGLSKAIVDSGKDRVAVAAEIEMLLGSSPDYPVSKATLDAWTAPSRSDWRFPLLYLPAFVQATGAHSLLDMVASRCGRHVVTAEQLRHARLGRVRAEIRMLQAEERALSTPRRGRR